MRERERTPLFSLVAPDYYAKNLPVIPLYPREKKPIPLDWSRYYDHPVELEQQKEWLEGIPDANIGLVLGPQSGVVMLDIDTTDANLTKVITSVLPVSPWVRIGAKGMVMAFRFNGLKTFRIKNTSGETICELLSSRTQCVLPPSIHPTTQLPYKANCELLSVIDNLPELPTQVEQLLRGALETEGVQLSHSGWTRVTDYVSAGSRDVAMTEKAGLFAYAVLRGERSLKEAIGMLQAYHQEFIEDVAGDPVDVEKHIQNMIKFLHRDVFDKAKILPEGWDDGLTLEDKQNLGLQFDEDHEEWAFEEIRDFLRDEFERHPDESAGRSKAVDRALDKIAKSSNLNKLEEDRLLQYIADVSGMGLKVASLRGRVKELRQGDLKGQDHTEIARAVIVDIEQTKTIRVFDGSIWKWGGSNWEVMDETEILNIISNNYGSLQACKRHSDIKGILQVIKFLLPQGLKTIDIKGVNFANGFLTEELKLLPHDMGYGMTYTLPFRYIPEKKDQKPLFDEFLKDSWGEDVDFQQKIDALQEALCITLFGLGPRFQRAILLQGVPKSGKSQMLKIATALVPDEARSAVPPNDWGDKFLPTQMHQKLINVAGELSEKKIIDGQKFKDIVDGTEMSGQFKGRDIFKFRPMCTHWFASNHYPKTDDTSEGFNRRWLMLTFNRPVDVHKRRLDLGDVIVAEEREAIVAWAVQSMGRLLAKKEYTIPSSHRDCMREVANLNNSVRFFLTEGGRTRVVPLQDGEKTSIRTSEHSLYTAYWSFCIGPGGVKPVGSTAFRSKMRELGPELGFKLVLNPQPNGTQEVIYENLTLVK